MTHLFMDADAVVAALRPTEPVLFSRPADARQMARAVVDAFPGTVAYAVKVCDRPAVLQALYEGGVREWDVASIHEVRAVRAQFPHSTLHYMNPVKPREHIAEAYGLGVRIFAFDCERELIKIAESTGGDRAVVPVLRLAVPNDKAMFPLDRKFGCEEDEGVRLLRLAVAMGYRTGVTFHVGSQCQDAAAYRTATDIVCRTARRAGVEPVIVDIGGGFPTAYTGTEPSFAACVAAAREPLERWFPGYAGTFQCEPGRLLAAPSASVLVRVELRKGENLFLNDGYYGLLSELKWMPALHPMRLVRAGEQSRAPFASFSFYGPTCDSHDAMEGPYRLPDDIDEGDWIEIALMGAYSTVLATRFNGFPEPLSLVVEERRPLSAAA